MARPEGFEPPTLCFEGVARLLYIGSCPSHPGDITQFKCSNVVPRNWVLSGSLHDQFGIARAKLTRNGGGATVRAPMDLNSKIPR